ncbi:MAG: CZB domain-containing protein [Candidatus Thiothrix sulfatifontis]|nr:MAG: CZB domain-containing protein [Candidatus Thiothrix sulfatifontis]
MASNNAFFIQRLNDHIQYLRKVTNTLKGVDDFEGTACTECKLGQWLYHNGHEHLQNSAPDGSFLFEFLEKNHKRFHDSSDEALAQYRNGNAVGSYRAVTEMHKLSNEMVALLLKADRHSRTATGT